MDIKRDILWRVYLMYILVILVCVVILGRAFYIQNIQGAQWRSLNQSKHVILEDIKAERGTIYSADGEMLSTSIPQFNVYVDFGVENLREKEGAVFYKYVDSLSFCLADLFKDKDQRAYRRLLQEGFDDTARHYLLKDRISYRDFQALKTFPIVRLGKNKGGFIIEPKSIRLNPYKMLAFRTIGLARDENNVGLEKAYDSVLRGKNGNRLVRYIGSGVSMPIEDEDEVLSENGKDIITNLDVFTQEVTENALMEEMQLNDAEKGCAIVMETKTGKIKAIANIGKMPDGSFWEDRNYALMSSEPGSTFKLVDLIALLEDRKITLDQHVNLENGKWAFAPKLTVFDSEEHKGENDVTIKHAFEMSSNVAMAKLIHYNYQKTNEQDRFLSYVSKLRLDTITGVDLSDEHKPSIPSLQKVKYSGDKTLLPWMAFGYNFTITPLQTLQLYNAVANNGRMMKPYLVSAIKEGGVMVKQIEPVTLTKEICSENTLKQIRQCLEGVCNVPGGTGYSLFKGCNYTVAGKTGTAQVAEKGTKYVDQKHQSSFVGYFPVENPAYTCIVLIINKRGALNYYGASVAGPVFKKIADRLYGKYLKQDIPTAKATFQKDSIHSQRFVGSKKSIATVLHSLHQRISNERSDSYKDGWINIEQVNNSVTITPKSVDDYGMPDLKGFALKDALVICESKGLKVNVKGKGKVVDQSILPFNRIEKGQEIYLALK